MSRHLLLRRPNQFTTARARLATLASIHPRAPPGGEYGAHLAGLKAAAREEWRARLVCKDPVMHTLAAPCGDAPAAQVRT